jgi:hypothetical protein
MHFLIDASFYVATLTTGWMVFDCDIVWVESWLRALVSTYKASGICRSPASVLTTAGVKILKR